MLSGLPVLFLTHGRSFGSHINREAPFVNPFADLMGSDDGKFWRPILSGVDPNLASDT